METDLLEIAYVPTTGVRQVHVAPLDAASDDSLAGYGCLVDEPKAFPIEIVRWPARDGDRSTRIRAIRAA
jgi:hypothetical protein